MAEGSGMRAVGCARIAVGAVIVVAVLATHVEALSRGPVNPFNMYGYFTVQSNLIASASWLIAGALAFRGRPRGVGLSLLGAVATTCLVIVGLVYAVLLAPLGAPGGVPLPWANLVLHVVSPVAAVVDWVLIGDRVRLSLSSLWVILLYPIVWTVTVLIRGATDGWVPYPFLDPAQGYGVVAGYSAAIAALFAVVGAAVLWVSRRRAVEEPSRVTRRLP
ncbi:MAG: Pr6Pr family membrane protein [Propionicimonas sp.]